MAPVVLEQTQMSACGSHLASDCVSSDLLWSRFASQLKSDFICGETVTAAKKGTARPDNTVSKRIP